MDSVMLIAALLSLPLLAPKLPNAGADETAVRAAHGRLLAAFKAKNADAIRALMTKDFIQSANGGTYNRDQAAAQMAQGAGVAKVDWSMTGLQVHQNHASYTSEFKFVMAPTGAQGKSHTVSGSGVQRVQLVKQGGKWLFSRMEVLSSKMFMDGKPMGSPSGTGKSTPK